MSRKSPNLPVLLRRIFYGYCAIVLLLMFGRPMLSFDLPYWEQLSASLNLIPFRSITVYLYLMIRQPNPELLPYAWINFVGNILLFVPLGFLLPCLARRVRSFLRILLTTAVLLLLLESLQLFTLLGSFDIDDIILNLLGVAFGYLIFHFARRKWNIAL